MFVRYQGKLNVDDEDKPDCEVLSGSGHWNSRGVVLFWARAWVPSPEHPVQMDSTHLIIILMRRRKDEDVDGCIDHDDDDDDDDECHVYPLSRTHLQHLFSCVHSLTPSDVVPLNRFFCI